jgi:hypothetical protein
MIVIREYGSIVTVLVGNFRKAITICLSFLIFPKPLSIYYLLGVVFVFGSLSGYAISKQRDKDSSIKKTASGDDDEESHELLTHGEKTPNKTSGGRGRTSSISR